MLRRDRTAAVMKYVAQLAVRKISLCEPLARGESRKRDSFLY